MPTWIASTTYDRRLHNSLPLSREFGAHWSSAIPEIHLNSTGRSPHEVVHRPEIGATRRTSSSSSRTASVPQ